MHRGPAIRTRLAGLLVAVAVLVAVGCTKTNDAGTATNGEAITNGTIKDGTPVFPLPQDPGAAVRQANLPELPTEGTVYHVHAHVDLEIDGHKVTIPANIGITKIEAGGRLASLSPLHTHDATGIAHIEAQKEDSFTVGQLFAEWGVRLDKTCVATYCTDDQNQLLGYLNGELVGDPASIPLTSHAEIYIWFGPKSAGNPKVAATYAFPPDLGP